MIALTIAALVAVAPAPAALSFEQAFPVHGEPTRIHYTALFRSSDGVHRMEVWREGDTRIKRRTDAALTSFATRHTGEDGYRLAILDHGRRIRTDVDRTNLYRIGSFADWFDLGHGLRHPKGAYRIVAWRPVRAPTAIEACDWYWLSAGAQTDFVCWARAEALPLLIVTADGRTVWRVNALDAKPLPAGTFAIDDAGYIRNDAARDISGD